MTTYYRWRKSSVTYPLVEIGRSSSWTETGYYPLYDDEVVEVLTCGLENLTITASAIIMNSPKSYSFGNNDSTGHYSGYTICRPWQSAKPTAYSTPYVYKSNQGNTRYNLFTEDTVTVTNPSNYPSAQIIKYGPGSPVAGDFIEYVYSTSPAPTRKMGSAGTTSTRTGRPSPSARRPASASHPTAQGGQQCIRELGSGLFRRRGHLQLRAEQAAGRRQLDGGGHLWQQHPRRLSLSTRWDGDHCLPGAGQG